MALINGNNEDVQGISLLEYLTDAGYEVSGVVVERNLEIIPREQLGQVIIQKDDTIEVLHFVGGG